MTIPVTLVPTVLSPNTVAFVTVGGTLIAALGSAIAAYFGNKNHNLTTQIHVDTNGRLSALTTEVAELKAAAVTAAAVAAAIKVGTDKAATLAAGTAATLAAAAAAPASKNAPNISGSVFEGKIAGTVAEGELKGTTDGTIK